MKLSTLIGNAVFTRRCDLCAEVIPLNEERCEDCKNTRKTNCSFKDSKMAYDSVCAPYFYEGGIKRAIAAFKYRGYKELAPALAGEMLEAIERDYNGICFDFVTFVPMTFIKKRKRGFNQSELLAREIAKALNCPCVKALRKTKITKSQQGSRASVRRSNLKNAFAICDVDVKGKVVLLIDDVRTTGSTLNECTRVLKKNGAKTVYAATIAVNEKR